MDGLGLDGDRCIRVIPQHHPPCGQTHACENITLAKTSFRPVKTRECIKFGIISLIIYM